MSEPREMEKRIAGLTREERALLFERLREQRKARSAGAAVTASAGAGERIPRRPVNAGPAPLSFGQQRMWLLDRLEPGRAAYHIPGAFHLSGPLLPAALRQALDAVVARHEALRTTFALAGDEPVQVAAPALHVPLPVVDLAAIGEAAGPERERLVVREFSRPFDLAAGPLLRALLLRCGAEDHLLVLTMHHVVSDGWSMGVLIREAATCYRAFAAGSVPELPELPIQYADFAVWQRQWLSGDVLAAQVAYWRQQLAGSKAVLDLPSDRPRPPRRTSAGAHLPVRVPAEATAALAALARQEGATQFMVLLAAFAAFLGRVAGVPEVAVGSPIAGRTRAEVSGLVGFFINTLVLRCDLAGDPAFRELVGRVRATALGAYGHQDLPFEKLVEELKPERDPARTPLFQVMLVLQNTPLPVFDLGGLRLLPVPFETGTAQFDLTLSLAEDGAELAGMLELDTDLFDRATAARLMGHLGTLLAAAVAAPERSLSDLPLLGPGERAQLLGEWNDTGREYPRVTIPDLVAARAESTPEAVALELEGERLTYREVIDRTRDLARRLRELGAGPDTVVGVCAERSLEMVIALLAILESGGAYLPLDPDQPKERLELLISDASPHVVLVQEHLAGRLEGLHTAGARVLALPSGGGRSATSTAAPSPDPDSLAYVIYTSGSTGRPKGVMIPHRGIANRLLWMQEAYGLTPDDRVLQKTPFGFDVSVWELFWPLLVGARLVVAPPGAHRDPEALTELIASAGVTTLHFVPSMLRAWLASPGIERCRAVLRRVIASGEALPPELVERFEQRLPGVELHNLYGPTEASVDVTAWQCLPRAAGAVRSVPIGRPISNTWTHVLDPLPGRQGGEPLPVGVPGELCLGGVGLARGYLGRPDLTAAAFVPDPFAASPGARLYRTGDLVRRLPDGTLEFLGRIDHQVKIRGVRIEPGEIEAVLARHPGVGEAVVVTAGADGERSLVACVVPRAGAAPAPAELRGFLLERLPEPMVPAAWLILDALPLGTSGKVDRRELVRRASGAAAARPAGGWVAPRGPVEELLAAVWADVLRLDAGVRVGAHDDFFELGGHSLLGAQVVSRVREVLGVELPLAVLFERRTLADLATEAERLRGGHRSAPPVHTRREGWLPLSFAQQRLWFLDQLEPGTPFYNMTLRLALTGPLRPDVLTLALAEVVRRHEGLRTTFLDRAGTPFQAIAPVLDIGLPVVDLGALPEREWRGERERLAAAEFGRPFDLARGPLLRTTLVRRGPAEHVALLTMHHIVSDGWSMGVLMEEIAALYGAFAAGRPSPLPELPIQYADYAIWQRERLQGEALAAEVEFWRRRLAGSPGLELPTDRPRPAIETFRGANHPVALLPELSQELGALARREGSSLFMVLLAGFAALLNRVSGQADLPIGTPIANRNHAEVEGLIGFFSNTLVLRADLAGRPSFRELLARVRELAIEAYAHQEVPFEKLVEELSPERDMSRNPLFQVMLVLQNQPRPRAEAADLAMAAESVDTGTAKFDLTLFWWEGDGRLQGLLEHNTDLFDRTTVRRFFEHQAALLAAAVADPDRPVAALPLLGAAERHQLAAEWNDTASPGLGGRCVHHLVEERAARTPDALAAAFGGRRLTYRELNARANRLAHGLRRLGVGPEALVGICVERSLDMVVAMLAVLKAGGAGVALDPAYPPDRLAFIVEDARLPVLLTQASLAGLFPGARAAVLLLDGGEPFPGESDEDPDVGVDLDHPIYAIYTSGSTGLPKGIVVTHRAFANLLGWQAASRSLAPCARTVQYATFGFCVSFQEIFSTWCAGGALVVASEATRRDVESLPAFLEAEEVERLHLPFAALKHLAEAAAGEGRLPSRLKEVITAGEQLQVTPAVRSLFERLPGATLHNQYGASETHVVTALTLAGAPGAWPAIPAVGRPVGNVAIHLLDAELAPVPIGVRGELYAAGACLPRGYLNDPATTAAKLVPDPFASEPGARLYRTGDLARRLAGGAIEYLGRIDGQVKIRGFRVELGEIETTLARHPSVRDAAVVAREVAPGVRQLIAYIVSSSPGTEPQGSREPELFAELARHLKEKLPEYMLPAAFVLLPALPLNANGKLDQAALPAPDADRSRLRAPYVAPRGPVEEVVAGIWAEVLGVAAGGGRVGVHDNFFELGGHSLLATQVASRVRAAFQVTLPLRRLFEGPTVAELAAAVLGGEARPGQSEKIARALLRLRAMSAEAKAEARRQHLAAGDGEEDG